MRLFVFKLNSRNNSKVLPLYLCAYVLICVSTVNVITSVGRYSRVRIMRTLCHVYLV